MDHKNCIHYAACKDWVYRSGSSDINRLKMLPNCEHFKPISIKTDLNRFTHICKAKGLVNGFSIFAKIIEETDSTVTIDRYQSFGALQIGKITISKEDFERYYKEINDDL